MMRKERKEVGRGMYIIVLFLGSQKEGEGGGEETHC